VSLLYQNQQRINTSRISYKLSYLTNSEVSESIRTLLYYTSNCISSVNQTIFYLINLDCNKFFSCLIEQMNSLACAIIVKIPNLVIIVKIP